MLGRSCAVRAEAPKRPRSQDHTTSRSTALFLITTMFTREYRHANRPTADTLRLPPQTAEQIGPRTPHE